MDRATQFESLQGLGRVSDLVQNTVPDWDAKIYYVKGQPVIYNGRTKYAIENSISRTPTQCSEHWGDAPNEGPVQLRAYCKKCEGVVYAQWVRTPTGMIALCDGHAPAEPCDLQRIPKR